VILNACFVTVSIRKDLQILGDSCKYPKDICKQSVDIQSSLQTTVRSEEEYWKDSYNLVVVAGHVDRPECWLFQLALLKGFSPDYRTITLVNTSTVTIIPATVLSF
jgi:hypothetical protein